LTWKFFTDTNWPRIRRVKCDETKPHCLRCAQTGRKCDGFPVPVPDHGGPAATPPPALPLRSVASYSIPFRIPGSQKDRQLLHYFCVQGVTDVSGFCGTAFWSQTVLQACQSDAIVRQALTALSSLHIDLATPDCGGAEAVQEATLARYGLALRALGRRVDKQDTQGKQDEAVIGALICCVLFYSFESALGSSKTAMRHLGSGLSLWAAHYSNHANNQDGCLDEISDVLARLDVQASFFNDSRVPTLPLVTADQRVLGLRRCPAQQSFSALHDAQRELVRLQNWLLRFLQENLAAGSGLQDTGIPGPILQEKKLLLSELGAWRQSIARLGEPSPSAADGAFLCGFQTLLVQHNAAQMLLASRVPYDDKVFGAVPNPAAEEIIRLAESVVRLHNNNGDAASRRTLSSETGIVAPLALLAVKCTDVSLCRRAVKLLIASQRREGLYDATTMATMVQRMELLRQQRLQGFASEPEPWVASLEHWTADAIDQAEGGMDDIGDRLAAMMEAEQTDVMLTGTIESTP
jgi:hypothetical protein